MVLRKSDKILSVYAIAVLLGVITGAIGSCFLLAINALSTWLSSSLARLPLSGFRLALISGLVSMLMIYGAWLMVKYFAVEASGSGVQEIEGVLLHKRPIFWRRLIPVKFLGGLLAISSQLVVGREGPTIQLGGNLGAMLAEFFRLNRHRRDALIAAGAAAGLATAFNAPLAGLLFVMEEMREEFQFSFTNFSAVAICCFVAVILLHCIIGAAPAIPMAVFSLPSLRSLSLFFLFGIVIGLVGWVFNVVLMKSLYFLDTFCAWQREVYVLMVGLVVGILVYVQPAAVGGGYDIIERSLSMSPSFSSLMFLVFLRFMTTMFSYNTGVPGGIFAPMLALGTLLGLAMSHVFQWMMLDMTVHPGMFAVAGMGALFASVVRAPVTGIVLVVEMTQNYSLILPLMVTCLTATTLVQLVGNPPIYTQLLKRTLAKQAALQRKS
jgi:CIC family chloride channel protein